MAKSNADMNRMLAGQMGSAAPVAAGGIPGFLKNKEALIGLGFMAVVLIMIIPMPAFALDLFLIISISSALVIFLIAVYTKRAIDFSIFPTVLLMVTIFRLALNIASTRLILTSGQNGSHGAGAIIGTFGNFVVGGNYVVGIIVFIILVVINFIVITKGAGRIAEVAARFTLDGMPGKQMAIDADLNAGLIDEAAAKRDEGKLKQKRTFTDQWMVLVSLFVVMPLPVLLSLL